MRRTAEHPDVAPHDNGVLARTLGKWDLALLVIGSVIGSGIFLVPGTVLMASNMRPEIAALAWAGGSVLALCGALAFAELMRLRPEAGGLYIIIRDAFGTSLGALFGWMVLLVTCGGVVAALASALADTLAETLHWDGHRRMVFAVATVLVVGVANLMPIRGSTRLQGLTASIKAAVLILIALMLIGQFVALDGDGAAVHPMSPVAVAARPSFIAAMVVVLWAFEGWQYATSAAGEVHLTRGTMTFGLVAGVFILAVVFLALSSAVSLWLTPEMIANNRNAVAAALAAAGFPVLSRGVVLLIALTIVTSAHATLLTGSRVVYAVARDRLLPAPLARLSRSGVPALAVVMCTATAAALTLIGTFETLLNYVVVTSWCFYALGAAAIFRPHWQTGGASSALARWCSAIFIAGALLVIGLSLISGPAEARYGLIWIAAAWIVTSAAKRIGTTRPN
jgi:APA family basic amino acid/polyamine antiporter